MRKNDDIVVFRDEIGTWGKETFCDGKTDKKRGFWLASQALEDLERYRETPSDLKGLSKLFIIIMEMSFINHYAYGKKCIRVFFEEKEAVKKYGLDDLVVFAGKKGASIGRATVKDFDWQGKTFNFLQERFEHLKTHYMRQGPVEQSLMIILLFAWAYSSKKDRHTFSQLVCRKMKSNRENNSYS